MTTLSQYLAAESADKSEPASFYAPGAESWDEQAGGMRARLIGCLKDTCPDSELFNPDNH